MEDKLRETIHRLLLECLNEAENRAEVVTITNRDDLKKYIPRVYEIMQKSYNNLKGGFLTADSEKKLLSGTQLLKAVFDSEGDIIACATYRSKGTEGFKMGAIGCDKTKSGAVAALSAIIQDGITNYKGWFWCEVSGAIEHYFKKYGGFPIPDVYVGEILGKPVKKVGDGFHYERMIGMDEGNVMRKCIFGFSSDEVYKKVTEVFDNYEGFRKIVNSCRGVGEAYMRHGDDYRKAMLILDEMDGFRWCGENGIYYYELPTKWYSVLEWAVGVMRNTEADDDTSHYYNELAEDLIDWFEPLTLNRF